MPNVYRMSRTTKDTRRRGQWEARRQARREKLARVVTMLRKVFRPRNIERGEPLRRALGRWEW